MERGEILEVRNIWSKLEKLVNGGKIGEGIVCWRIGNLECRRENTWEGLFNWLQPTRGAVLVAVALHRSFFSFLHFLGSNILNETDIFSGIVSIFLVERYSEYWRRNVYSNSNVFRWSIVNSKVS